MTQAYIQITFTDFQASISFSSWKARIQNVSVCHLFEYFYVSELDKCCKRFYKS